MKQEYSKNKKNTNEKQTHWMKKYVVFAVILVLITSLFCVSFAWYIDTVTRRGVVSFGEINISDDPNDNVFEENTLIENVVPNKKIADSVYFSKAETSRAFYVRLKMRYTLETPSTAVGLIPWVASINASPITQLESSDYAWTTILDDGYYYLVKEDDDSMMYKVETTDRVYFTSDLRFPSGNVQLLDDSGNPVQKGYDIKLSIIIEAVQADIPEILDGSKTPSRANVSSYFSASEKDIAFVEYLETNGTQYIDTGLETCDGLSSEVKYYTTNKSQWLYGGRKSDNSSGFTFFFTSVNNEVIALTADQRRQVTLTYSPYQITTLVQGTTSAYFKDSSGATHSIATYSKKSYKTRTSIYLFYVNGNSSGGMFKGKIYSMKFYVNDMIVLDLKPAVVRSTGKPILYDTITGRHYVNNGTGDDFVVPAY